MAVVDLADLLACGLEVCRLYDGSVTSWKRSVMHNMMVGGVSNSDHLTGCALDIVYDNVVRPGLGSLSDLCSQYGCGILRERSHDHIYFKREMVGPRDARLEVPRG